MARKKSGGDGGGDAGTWLNTYADMVTLLLTFFAVLLSMSSVNQEKFDAMMQNMQELAPDTVQNPLAPGTQSGGTGENAGALGNMSDLYEEMKTYIEKAGMQSDIQLSLKDQVIYIKFNSNLIFEPNKYSLKTGSTPALESVADMLVKFEPNIKMLNIYGHTAKVDSSQEDTYTVSSWMLSSERAGAVANYLSEVKEFDSNKMVALGYGSTRPIGDNNTAKGRAENRRVEFLVIGKDSNVSSDTYQQMNNFFDGTLYPVEGGADNILGTGSEIPGEQPQTNNTAAPAPSGNVDANVNPYQNEIVQ